LGKAHDLRRYGIDASEGVIGEELDEATGLIDESAAIGNLLTVHGAGLKAGAAPDTGTKRGCSLKTGTAREGGDTCGKRAARAQGDTVCGSRIGDGVSSRSRNPEFGEERQRGAEKSPRGSFRIHADGSRRLIIFNS
jgi:hypothetical protein